METTNDGLRWRKARASSAENGCVEIADRTGNVFIRDEAARERGALTVSTATFSALLASVRAGELDL